jgi:hypothetical protein
MQNPQTPSANATDRAQLEGLYARRTDLAEQIQLLSNRRGELADQIARTEFAQRARPQERLNELDARIAKAEQEAALTDEKISAMLHRGVTVDRSYAPGGPPVFEAPPFPFPGVIDVPPAPRSDREIQRLMGMEAVGLLLLTAVLCRWTWLRAKARFAPRMPAENPQLQQAVDAIAIEVERISEGQRFVTTLLSQRASEKRDAQLGSVPAKGRERIPTPV